MPISPDSDESIPTKQRQEFTAMTMRVLDEQWQQDNPLDVVEEIVTANEWPFDRQGDDELSVSITGGWCDYHLGFSFCAEQGGMQLACAYDMKVPNNRMRDVHTLLAHINERMWLGHFDLWSDDAIPMYRNGVLLRENEVPRSRHMEELIEIAITECERYYPAFQFVIWGGKSPSEAVAAAMLDTVGEA